MKYSKAFLFFIIVGVAVLVRAQDDEDDTDDSSGDHIEFCKHLIARIMLL